MNIKEMKALYLKANRAYHNTGKKVMEDTEFDKLETKIRKADPEWDQLKRTGVPVENKKTEVALEFFMPSLRKFYPDKIDKWLEKNGDETIVMAKLDGSAVQLTYNKGLPVKLITRGNGTRGGDISFLLPYLKLPIVTVKTKMVFRCEAVMRESIFQKKYAEEFENARNMVNGILNRKTPHKALNDIDIVILGLYGSTVLKGLNNASSLGFSVVDHDVERINTISRLLKTFNKECEYKMDGLVLCKQNALFEYDNADKPKWAIAYKENEAIADAAQAKVLRIIWQDSMNSRLIPKIEIEPIRIGGVTVTYVTCHNAKWMVDRCIGPGAIIQVVRSGDVIPKIVGVVKKGKLQMPKVEHKLVGVHFIASVRSEESAVRELHKFFKTLGIEFIARATIDTLWGAGMCRPQDYMTLWRNFNATRLQSLGLGKAMSVKIYAELDRVFKPGVLLRDLMVASNCFGVGIGERKLKAIEAHHKASPNILAYFVKAGGNKQSFLELQFVPGFSEKSAQLIVDGMPAFVPWLLEALKYIKIRTPVVKTNKAKSKALEGCVVSFTTYRDKVHEQFITENGGEVINFGSKTTHLIYKDGTKVNSKIEKAKASGIKVLSFKDFKKLKGLV